MFIKITRNLSLEEYVTISIFAICLIGILSDYHRYRMTFLLVGVAWTIGFLSLSKIIEDRHLSLQSVEKVSTEPKKRMKRGRRDVRYAEKISFIFIATLCFSTVVADYFSFYRIQLIDVIAFIIGAIFLYAFISITPWQTLFKSNTQ